MKLEIERQEFLKAWQNAEKLALTKSPSESTSRVLIIASGDNTVTLEATDLSASVRCVAKGANVLEPGRALVPAAIFGGILRKLDKDSNDLLLEVNSARGFLNAGRNKMRFSVISPEEFPNIPESSSAETVCEISAPILSKLIAEGSAAASQPQDFPKYLGTCLLRTEDMTLTLVSTDGKRLAVSKSLCNPSKNCDIILPAQALKDFARTTAPLKPENMVTIRADGSSVWFMLEDSEHSMRSVDAAFPKFERIINDECMTTLRINGGELLSALERIDIIAKKTVAHIMSMSMDTDGEVNITARAPELGTAREILQASVDGSSLHLGFNVEYFMDGLKALGSEQAVIEFSGEEGQTRIRRDGDGDFMYMLMPARLSTQDAMTDEESADFTDAAPDPEPLTESQPAPEPQQEDSKDSQENHDNNEDDTPF